MIDPSAPSFELVSTEGVSAQIVNQLSKHLSISRGRYLYLRASADVGNLPQIIQLVGDAVAWLPLAAFAAAYLKRLAEKSADATWDLIRKKFDRSDKSAVAFVESVTILAEARAAMAGKGAIIVGLNCPQPHWGTVVIIKDEDPIVIAEMMAKFAVNAERISSFVHNEMDSGAKPLGHVNVEFLEDGQVRLNWIDQAGFKIEERFLGK